MCVVTIWVPWETNFEMEMCVQVAPWGGTGTAPEREGSGIGRGRRWATTRWQQRAQPIPRGFLGWDDPSERSWIEAAGTSSTLGCELFPERGCELGGGSCFGWGKFLWKGSAVSPRGTQAWQLGEWVVLKGAPWWHHQHPHSWPLALLGSTCYIIISSHP